MQKAVEPYLTYPHCPPPCDILVFLPSLRVTTGRAQLKGNNKRIWVQFIHFLPRYFFEPAILHGIVFVSIYHAFPRLAC